MLFRLVLLLAVAFIVFFFWASASDHTEDDYAKIVTYQSDREMKRDSVFTIVAYNIGYLSGMTNNTTKERTPSLFDDNLSKVNEVFSKLDVDILALQEIDYASKRSFDVDQQEALSRLGFCYAAQAVNWDKRYVPFPRWPIAAHFGEMLSGQSIMSKFPIEEHKRIVLDRVAGLSFLTDAFYLERLAQMATIEVGGKKLKVINIHAEAFDKTTRERHLKACAELYTMYASTFPTILLGDFNSDPNEEDLLDTHIFNLPYLKQAVIDMNEGTFPSDAPRRKIDFIFYNENFIEKVAGKTIIEMGSPSDHLPVLMRFKLK